MFSIHPGIWGAAVTLAAGLTTNVAVFSTYQTGGSILDLSDIPEDIKTGKFDWTNQTKVRQYTYFTKWQWAATWYLSHCMKEAVDTKYEKTCNEHREEYDTAPEVRNPKASIEELRKYHESLMASRRL
ncbi:hypothetical protein MHLP_04390 [Candidatus Mycoplasma haematolamae str. Purdue]|uniref:Uncharacterized protein n=1 Tax=Mycoplasma haematolamae (strain Purdue) TaxID=1212765 RepID=I7BKP4_MYCHA|nr:hypothetical protein [Candidatus Mycoplasma haematolamae]AFO52458.1 hypothetical protein MHLP_04390 [Candidatus Mycoplasma haematolamae str. Purdue]